MRAVGNLVQLDDGVADAVLGQCLLRLIAIEAVRFREKHDFGLIDHLFDTNCSIKFNLVIILYVLVGWIIIVAAAVLRLHRVSCNR